MSGHPGEPPPGPALECDGLRRSFGATHALNGFTMSLPPGEVIALVGPNGSGKTTLLLILSGLLAPDGGSARVGGFNPVHRPFEVHSFVGWMPDFFGTYDDLPRSSTWSCSGPLTRCPRPSRPNAVVFLLTIGTLILFGVAAITAPTEVVEYGEGDSRYEVEERVIGWRWVILAPNPFVVLADAAPRSNSRFVPDPLEGMRDAVRESRRPPGAQEPFEQPEPPPLWPAGIAIELALAIAAGYFTVSCLRIPARKLAPGQRVA